MSTDKNGRLLLPSGGYEKLKSFQEELKFDYQDFLRQHCVQVRTTESMLYQEFIRRRISKAAEFKKFINPPFKSVLVANVEHKK